MKFEHYRRWMFRHYAKKIGFDMSGLLVNTLPPLYSFTKLPIVTLAMSELEFPYKKPKNIIYVGAMVHESRSDKIEISADSNELNRILKNVTALGKKLIYCSVGSLAKGHLPFIKNVIDAVSEEENWHLILSIGPKMDVNDFSDPAKNISIFNWVSQLEILKNTDCCITHCGINSINECIHHKVPMLLYSGKYTDENGNAARMSYHGLGIRGDINQDTSVIIKANLEQVLKGEVYRTNLNKFHNIYLDYKARPLTPQLFDFK